MNPVLKVIEPGARTLVQDQGFRNVRGIGVPAGGALDRTALRLVNALLGNPAQTEVLEIALSSPCLRATGGPVWVATSGGLSGVITSPNGDSRVLAEWTATCLNAEDELRLAPPFHGVAALGIGGGLKVPMVLGSRSTCDKAGFGGFKGRSLVAGDLLPVGRFEARLPDADRGFRLKPYLTTGPIRVVAGPQPENFTESTYATFFGTGYRVTPRMDRMGMRLDGARLEHSSPGACDIISDGAAQGAIQVPGNGLPIILLADAQTTGGYPKIATVIRADLPRLAACLPGDVLRFAGVTVVEAEAAARAQDRELAAVTASICDLTSASRTAQDLLALNLISGMVDMARPDHFPGHVCGADDTPDAG